jgi:dTDP-4-dehydrorhamnose 3,5-epimerase
VPEGVLRTETTDIAGLFRLDLKSVGDGRGAVREFYRESDFSSLEVGALGPWRQVNLTRSGRGVIRGLHGELMTKLVSVAWGEALGAYVDARRDSASYGRVVTLALEPGLAVLVPPGVCNGFQSLSPEGTQYLYCFDSEWSPDMPGVAVSAFDPDLGINWPLAVDPEDRNLVSAKDAALPRLADVALR